MTTKNQKTRCPSMVPKSPTYGAVTKTGKFVTCNGGKGSSGKPKASNSVASSELVGQRNPRRWIKRVHGKYSRNGDLLTIRTAEQLVEELQDALAALSNASS